MLYYHVEQVSFSLCVVKDCYPLALFKLLPLVPVLVIYRQQK